MFSRKEKNLPKLSANHKAIMVATAILVAAWIAFAIVKADVIRENQKFQTLFCVLASLMIIFYFGFLYVIIYPDVSYTSRRINDANRDRIYYVRRTAFAVMQFIYVFFLGGMSVSLYYDRWRLGFSVVVPVFRIVFAVTLACYGVSIAKCFGITENTEDKNL